MMVSSSSPDSSWGYSHLSLVCMWVCSVRLCLSVSLYRCLLHARTHPHTCAHTQSKRDRERRRWGGCSILSVFSFDQVILPGSGDSHLIMLHFLTIQPLEDIKYFCISAWLTNSKPEGFCAFPNKAGKAESWLIQLIRLLALGHCCFMAGIGVTSFFMKTP